MEPKKVAQLLALLNPELAQEILRLLDAVPKYRCLSKAGSSI